MQHQPPVSAHFHILHPSLLSRLCMFLDSFSKSIIRPTLARIIFHHCSWSCFPPVAILLGAVAYLLYHKYRNKYKPNRTEVPLNPL